MSLSQELETTDDSEYVSWVRTMLMEGPCRVVFTKRDGTDRTMICTTNSQLTVPYEKKTDRVKPANPDVCFVFDLELQEWRSFKINTMKEFSTNVTYNR